MRRLSAFVMVSMLLVGLAATGQQSALDTVKAKGVLRVGMAQTNPGCFIDINTGQWTGITVDLFTMLADQLGVRLEIVETTWDLFIVQLNNREFDVFGSTTFYTPTRSLQVSYTVPLFYKGVGLMCLATDTRFQSLEDIRNTPGVIVGVRLGAVEETVVPRILPNARMDVYKTDTAPVIAEGLRAGTIDIWAADEVMQVLFQQQNPWGRIVAVIGSHPVGFVVRQGDDTWLNFLNSYITYVRSSGDLAIFFERYGQPLSTLYPPQY